MKREFEYGDYVKLSNPYRDEFEFGYIYEYDRKSKDWVVRVIGTGDYIHVADEELTYLPPFELTEDFLEKFLQYDLTWADYAENIVPEGNWDYEEECGFVLRNMISLLNNLQEKKPTDAELTAWLKIIIGDFKDLYWCGGGEDFDRDQLVMGFPQPKSDGAMAQSIFSALYDLMLDGKSYSWTDKINIPQILADVENYKQNKPMKLHLWTTGHKHFALKFAEEPYINTLTQEEKSELKGIILELSELGHVSALDILAYAYYGGDELFACDWEKSRDCFLQLLEMDCVSDLDKCQYANSLGYIFYYGRCTDGVPEYEKAYKYFSLGAAGGVHESMYKLSDLYANGYGVAKNIHAAVTLVETVYEDNLQLIEKGDFDCQFADAARRVGNLCRDGLLHGDEYYFYTLADYALRKRLVYDYYGDSQVSSLIQKELTRVREKRPLKIVSAVTTRQALEVFMELFEGHSCQVSLRPLKEGIKITAKRLPKPGSKDVESIFECYPESGYCRLISEASITVYGAKPPQLGEKRSFIADCFEVTWEKCGIGCVFSHHGEKQLDLTAEKCIRKLPAKSKKELAEYLFASVVFNVGGHTYDYICEIADAQIGDKVVVFANGEEKEVEIVRLFRMVIGDMPLPVERYKKILRKA